MKDLKKIKTTKNDYVKKHNFNYGTGVNNNDSVINKLKLRTKQDLTDYIEDLLYSTLSNVKIKNNIVSNIDKKTNQKVIIEII